MPAAEGALSAILKRDRAIVGVALLVITALAWFYVLKLAYQMNSATPMAPGAAMPGMGGMDMASMRSAMAPVLMPWTPSHARFIFAMWAVMMVGMMTPSASPMILLYTRVARQAPAFSKPFAPAAWFASGYLLAWISFSAFATAAQYGLERAALLTPMMASASKWLGGGVLIVAGLYQFTPLKNACLTQCRNPLSFVQNHGGFKSTVMGSLELGARHGLYCIGCCWALMALLFVFGVMNVLWIAALAIFVLAEKVVPGGRYVSWVAGAAALVAGAWTLAV